ncbi:hypothetical protein [Streptomyces europaeiscabiei]|uniref:hypothetical protein n=1 Tax=Streptomyces europaeiscabiei TaxID=146819 RepID=UPI0029B1691B|nr:hypothetical protein [Streptomyces europaeiscabiei]MDX3588555.1 hypothetical protein [Streptomyces europaeiscabiei]
MPTSSTTPDREAAKARVRAKVEAARALPASEQIVNTLHATRTTAEAQALMAQLRAEILAEAIEAARGEYLNDDTKTPEDEAYNQAVSDVVAAIGALTEGGAA